MRYRTNPKNGRGFTLVELLVVIAIIGMLVALLIPAVSAARARMRAATCLNNLKNIGVGMIAFESSKGRLPGYVEPVKVVGRETGELDFVKWIPGTAGTEYVGSRFAATETSNQADARRESRVSWAAHLLPDIDRQDLWDIVVGAEADAHQLSNQQVLTQVGLYVCPDDTDITSAVGAAGLSYIVNTGAWDWESNGDFHGAGENGDTKDNGLFQNRVVGNIKSTLGGIRDGAATTLMVSENMHKNPTYSWFGVEPANPGEQQFGMVWVVSTQPGAPQSTGGCGSDADQAPFKFEAEDLDFPEDQPCYARPNSNHPGDRFNVIYADGHGQSIGMDIDYIVYQQLLTTHGAKCVDPHDDKGDAPTGAIVEFRSAAPLSTSDLE
ncbi:MAG: DUF1559 domain-containing protein [Aeoliella sp.]